MAARRRQAIPRQCRTWRRCEVTPGADCPRTGGGKPPPRPREASSPKRSLWHQSGSREKRQAFGAATTQDARRPAVPSGPTCLPPRAWGVPDAPPAARGASPRPLRSSAAGRDPGYHRCAAAPSAWPWVAGGQQSHEGPPRASSGRCDPGLPVGTNAAPACAHSRSSSGFPLTNAVSSGSARAGTRAPRSMRGVLSSRGGRSRWAGSPASPRRSFPFRK